MPAPTIKTFTAKALADERARRVKNKARRKTGEKTTRARSWVFGGMDDSDIEAVLAGETVAVDFAKRVVHVSLKD